MPSNDALITTAMTLVGLAMALSVLPQILRVLRLRSSRDVSIATFAIIGAGQVCWFAYGLYRGDAALWVTNGVAVVLSGATVAVALRYREGGPPPPA